ncbi:zinc finger protein, CCHC-type [Teratosphaeria destructans]|uniref:Zinc finger protein, CCHC-type n=1 Tax=Teratosphaeria destructans TaxID=418781 RepID=A0A9W7SKF4_9PEZI|nr:zinc finger protein, CCHC-type [Teratosphaeria destructans]
MEEIDSLRQQLAAAEFLVTSLRSQLARAEAHYHHYHSGRVIISRSDTDVATTQAHAEQQCTHQSDSHVPTPRTQDDIIQERAFPTEEIESRTAPQPYPQGHIRRDPPDKRQAGISADEQHEASGDDVEEIAAEPAETIEPAEYPIPEGMTLPNVSVKTIFPDLGTVKAAIEAYALAQGWTPATKKRDRLRICMGCRTAPNCTFHVRAETCVEGARISASKMAHTCQTAIAGGDVPKRHHVASLRFLRQEVPKFMEITKATPTKDIQDAVLERFGTKISLAQCSKLRGRIREKKSSQQGCSNCGGHGHNKLTCPTAVRKSLGSV